MLLIIPIKLFNRLESLSFIVPIQPRKASSSLIWALVFFDGSFLVFCIMLYIKEFLSLGSFLLAASLSDAAICST